MLSLLDLRASGSLGFALLSDPDSSFQKPSCAVVYGF